MSSRQRLRQPVVALPAASESRDKERPCNKARQQPLPLYLDSSHWGSGSSNGHSPGLLNMLLCFNLSVRCMPLPSVFNHTKCGLVLPCQLLEPVPRGVPLQGEPARKRRRTKSDAAPRDRDEEDTGIQGGEAAASILRGELALALLWSAPIASGVCEK